MTSYHLFWQEYNRLDMVRQGIGAQIKTIRQAQKHGPLDEYNNPVKVDDWRHRSTMNRRSTRSPSPTPMKARNASPQRHARAKSGASDKHTLHRADQTQHTTDISLGKWATYDGKLYDVTEFLQSSPGGVSRGSNDILREGGRMIL